MSFRGRSTLATWVSPLKACFLLPFTNQSTIKLIINTLLCLQIQGKVQKVVHLSQSPMGHQIRLPQHRFFVYTTGTELATQQFFVLTLSWRLEFRITTNVMEMVQSRKWSILRQASGLKIVCCAVERTRGWGNPCRRPLHSILLFLNLQVWSTTNTPSAARLSEMHHSWLPSQIHTAKRWLWGLVFPRQPHSCNPKEMLTLLWASSQPLPLPLLALPGPSCQPPG